MWLIRRSWPSGAKAESGATAEAKERIGMLFPDFPSEGFLDHMEKATSRLLRSLRT